MRPQSAYRLALVMIPLSIVLGLIGALVGNWLVVAVMALNLIGQLVNFRSSRRRLRKPG